MDIQWYPGHMTKTRRMIQESIARVDIVVELLDARIPSASRNPDMDSMTRGKKRIMILNKADLADGDITGEWIRYFESQGSGALPANSTSGKGLEDLVKTARFMMKDKIERQKQRGRIFVPIRAMITGIPNVGKSTLINHFAGRAVAQTADRPGVTRAGQWVRLRKDFELLDTPGILWPKFEDEMVGILLAVTGAVKDEVVDQYTLSLELIQLLCRVKPESIVNRYGVPLQELETQAPDIILRSVAERRGFKKKGGEADVDRAAIILLDEFRGGRLGRITLERPAIIK